MSLLQSDLRSLSVEARRRHADVKEAADRGAAAVRVHQEAPGAAGAAIGDQPELCEELLRPCMLACATNDARLVLIAVGCLHKLISNGAVPRRFLSAVLISLQEQASGPDDGVQAKILQTVLSLMGSEAYSVSANHLGKALSICLNLHDSNNKNASPLIRSTAAATLRQAVCLLFERVVAVEPAAVAAAEAAEDDGVTQDDAGRHPTLHCAELLCRDLCSLARGQPAVWLNANSLELMLILDLFESLLSDGLHEAFAAQEPLCHLLKEDLCPLTMQLIESEAPLPLFVRALRIILLCCRHLAQPLQAQCEALICQLTASLDGHKAGSARTETAPLWLRTLTVDFYAVLVKHVPFAELFVQYEAEAGARAMGGVLAALVQCLKRSMQQEPLCLPTAAGGIDVRLSLQSRGMPVPNSSPERLVSAAFGLVVDIAAGVSGPILAAAAPLEGGAVPQAAGQGSAAAHVFESTWPFLLDAMCECIHPLSAFLSSFREDSNAQTPCLSWCSRAHALSIAGLVLQSCEKQPVIDMALQVCAQLVQVSNHRKSPYPTSGGTHLSSQSRFPCPTGSRDHC